MAVLETRPGETMREGLESAREAKETTRARAATERGEEEMVREEAMEMGRAKGEGGQDRKRTRH